MLTERDKLSELIETSRMKGTDILIVKGPKGVKYAIVELPGEKVIEQAVQPEISREEVIEGAVQPSSEGISREKVIEGAVQPTGVEISREKVIEQAMQPGGDDQCDTRRDTLDGGWCDADDQCVIMREITAVSQCDADNQYVTRRGNTCWGSVGWR